MQPGSAPTAISAPEAAGSGPHPAGDDTADRVLLGLARSPHAFGESFGDMAPPLQFQFKPYQDLLTSQLLQRVGDAERTTPGALA
ncbi:hypothetical protein [Kitasatospora sp. NPDC088351]|uniref:hypothetical protein n=1 Tax=unclassified Kitasatospora TaxID=2633591 RepID=UPI003418244B